MLTLTKSQARKFIVLSNDFNNSKKKKSIYATHETFEHLGYVQLDTISVVNRAHLHVLWSRNHHFKESHLEELFTTKKIFEYWSHAAAMLPMKDFDYSLIRKQQILNGEKHWFKKQPKMMQEVKETIKKEGPKKSSDFKYKRNSKSEWWDWKPAKLALEQLYMQGDLMVLKRVGFQKVYDLTENVLPDSIRPEAPNMYEYCKYLIRRYLQSQGLGKAESFAYLLKGIKPKINETIYTMLEDGELEKVMIEGQEYFALSHRLQLLEKRLSKNVHILSPFDNMVIQRKRLLELFDYDYQIECYVPESKRKFGYFCLPILYGSELVGRIDCKSFRKNKVLKINNLHIESNVKNNNKFLSKLNVELDKFAQFNYCQKVIY